ncbi:unnamed protein product [Caenorhabditis bovis]|uniref:WAP domain-containing protein n=1 Tax=Caenorhabditis bovis TaxID=2654633 RepID=A0A8S1E5M9_9PELO|nr:unnamed protein product [Caenorhabditis bovis]
MLIVLFLGFFPIFGTPQSDKIDWCLYFQSLKIYKPECKFYDAKFHTKSVKAFPVAPNEIQQCSPHYIYCTTNSQCADGYRRCIDMLKYRECCAPIQRECPAISYLRVRCLISNPVNWCDADGDCRSAPLRKCCPTGCNYNICL